MAEESYRVIRLNKNQVDDMNILFVTSNKYCARVLATSFEREMACAIYVEAEYFW